MLSGRMCAFVKFLVTQFGSKGVSATMEESAGQAVHMHVYVHLGAKAEPCGRSTPPAAPRRSHVDACALCVVRCAQRWRFEIKKMPISLKTCITSWSLGPPPFWLQARRLFESFQALPQYAYEISIWGSPRRSVLQKEGKVQKGA